MDPSGARRPLPDGSVVHETVSHAIERFRASGYVHDFSARPEGLFDCSTGRTFAPEHMVVDEIVRFEGITDPGDEAIVCAVRDPEGGTRGTFSAAYGPMASRDEVRVLQRLPPQPRGRTAP